MDSGDIFTRNGRRFRFTLEPDTDHGPPWEEEDGHGPVSNWTRRGKRPGEVVLCEDRGSKRYYDVQAATETAKRDGWDAPPYGGTPGERAARAVAADLQRLRDWCEDRWSYVGVVVTEVLNDRNGRSDSLWGIESDAGDYLTEVAYQLADELTPVPA